MDVTVIVSFITLAAVIIGAVVNVSTMVGRSEAKAVETAETRVMLNNIYTKVDNIEKRQLSIENTLQQHGERITKVEESTKSAHHRLDRLDENKK